MCVCVCCASPRQYAKRADRLCAVVVSLLPWDRVRLLDRGFGVRFDRDDDEEGASEDDKACYMVNSGAAGVKGAATGGYGGRGGRGGRGGGGGSGSNKGMAAGGRKRGRAALEGTAAATTDDSHLTFQSATAPSGQCGAAAAASSVHKRRRRVDGGGKVDDGTELLKFMASWDAATWARYKQLLVRPPPYTADWLLRNLLRDCGVTVANANARATLAATPLPVNHRRLRVSPNLGSDALFDAGQCVACTRGWRHKCHRDAAVDGAETYHAHETVSPTPQPMSVPNPIPIPAPVPVSMSMSMSMSMSSSMPVPVSVVGTTQATSVPASTATSTAASSVFLSSLPDKAAVESRQSLGVGASPVPPPPPPPPPPASTSAPAPAAAADAFPQLFSMMPSSRSATAPPLPPGCSTAAPATAAAASSQAATTDPLLDVDMAGSAVVAPTAPATAAAISTTTSTTISTGGSASVDAKPFTPHPASSATLGVKQLRTSTTAPTMAAAAAAAAAATTATSATATVVAPPPRVDEEALKHAEAVRRQAAREARTRNRVRCAEYKWPRVAMCNRLLVELPLSEDLQTGPRDEDAYFMTAAITQLAIHTAQGNLSVRKSADYATTVPDVPYTQRVMAAEAFLYGSLRQWRDLQVCCVGTDGVCALHDPIHVPRVLCGVLRNCAAAAVVAAAVACVCRLPLPCLHCTHHPPPWGCGCRGDRPPKHTISATSAHAPPQPRCIDASRD